VTAYVDEIRPAALSKLAPLAALLAVAALAVGIVLGDADTFWRSFHVNYLYFGVLAQGGVVLSCIFTIVGAKWPGPVKRLAESLGLWTAVTPVLFIQPIDHLGDLGNIHGFSPWLPIVMHLLRALSIIHTCRKTIKHRQTGSVAPFGGNSLPLVIHGSDTQDRSIGECGIAVVTLGVSGLKRS
jgi:hypothetical protein